MSDIGIIYTDNHIKVHSPSFPRFTRFALFFHGKKDGNSWTFPIEKLDVVRAGLIECYGTDGTHQTEVEVIINPSDIAAEADGNQYLAGIRIDKKNRRMKIPVLAAINAKSKCKSIVFIPPKDIKDKDFEKWLIEAQLGALDVFYGLFVKESNP